MFTSHKLTVFRAGQVQHSDFIFAADENAAVSVIV